MAKEKLSNELRYGLHASEGTACGFCIMLASRGYVYHSDGWLPHNNCNCPLVLGDPKTDKVPNQDEYYELYLRGREIANGGEYEIYKGSDLWNEWINLTNTQKAKYEYNQFLEQYITGSKEFNTFCAERISDCTGRVAQVFNRSVTKTMKELDKDLKLYDKEWLRTGKIPQWEKTKDARPSKNEINTAERLSRLGIYCKFRFDVERLPNGDNRGLADLINGMELKYFKGSYSTMEGHVKDAKHKGLLNSVVIDITDNKLVPHTEIIKNFKDNLVKFDFGLYIIDGINLIKLK